MKQSDSAKNDKPSKSLNDKKGSSSKSKWLFRQIKFSGIVVLMVSLFPLLSSVSSIFELYSHFRLQMLVASAVALVLLVIYRCKFYVIPAAMALAINGFAIYPLFFGAQPRAAIPNFRLLTANVSCVNQDFGSILACIRDSDADVVCVQELSPAISDYLAKNLTDYPHRLVDPREDPFGIGIFSRHYINSNMIIPSESSSDRTKMVINSAMVGITIGDHELKVISTHPPPPVNQYAFDWRNKQLEFIAGMAAASKDPMIIAGDLNCSPYSPSFSNILKQGNLNDSEIGFGIQASWPTTMWILAIPIDHVLYKGPIQVVNRRLGSSIGSDHTPVVVSFRIGN